MPRRFLTAFLTRVPHGVHRGSVRTFLTEFTGVRHVRSAPSAHVGAVPRVERTGRTPVNLAEERAFGNPVNVREEPP